MLLCAWPWLSIVLSLVLQYRMLDPGHVVEQTVTVEEPQEAPSVVSLETHDDGSTRRTETTVRPHPSRKTLTGLTVHTRTGLHMHTHMDVLCTNTHRRTFADKDNFILCASAILGYYLPQPS